MATQEEVNEKDTTLQKKKVMSLATGVNRGGEKKKKQELSINRKAVSIRHGVYCPEKFKPHAMPQSVGTAASPPSRFFFFFNFALHTLTAKLRNERERNIYR